MLSWQINEVGAKHTLMSLSPRSLTIEVQPSTLGVRWFSGGMTGSRLKKPPSPSSRNRLDFSAVLCSQHILQTYCVTLTNADLLKLGTAVGRNINGWSPGKGSAPAASGPGCSRPPAGSRSRGSESGWPSGPV